ncbi:MAG: lysophospholipid acyltransferase family protein [Bdellovibrionales bacterium]|nr:lysophospholipid acyltransferase family protein [Bdellovibrionales bacterium]
MFAYFVFAFYKLLQWTWTVEVLESESLKKALKENSIFVIAHWHGEEVGLLHLLKPYHAAAMVSHSKDGELITKVIELSGSKVSRGSSSRGAVGALKGILRLSKEGWRPSVAVDGPRGPRHQVKQGVLEISRVIRSPVYTISMAASKTYVLQKSWNKMEIPLPFSKIVVSWSEPITVTNPDEFEQKKQVIADSLQAHKKICLSYLEKNRSTPFPQT